MEKDVPKEWICHKSFRGSPEGTPLEESLTLREMYFADIPKSQIAERYYRGSTSNLNERLRYHNTGKVKSTKAYHPWKLHYYEEFFTKSEALKRENFFKSINGYNWLKKNNII